MVGSSLTNHPVFLTYDIVNNYPFSKNFTLEAFVEDQNDTSITFYKKQVLKLGACESTGNALKWSFVPTKSGTYSLNVNIDGQFRLGYGFQVIDAHSDSNPNSQVASSPLQQFKSGISAQSIQCKKGLQLVIKTEDSSPACVRSDTAKKLLVRGWGTFTASSINGINNQEKNGTLSGVVSAYVYGGPLTTLSPNRSVHYEVDVYATDGVTIVGKTLSDANAYYSVQLPTGNYIIYTYNDTKQTHLVSVYSGKNTIFNISSSINVP